MRKALHDLCQPLTTLEGLLYVQTLTRGSSGEPVASDAELWRSIDDALQECNRMFTIVRTMQDRLADDRPNAARASDFAPKLDDSNRQPGMAARTDQEQRGHP
jgi:hypothetical protein